MLRCLKHDHDKYLKQPKSYEFFLAGPSISKCGRSESHVVVLGENRASIETGFFFRFALYWIKSIEMSKFFRD